MKRDINLAVLAHVDAGKTTLSESLLFQCGAIRKKGRVDHKDAFLDTAEMEKERGITIYTKQARLEIPNYILTLIDTPGHVDFSAEMERALSVLDYAILVVSAADGVQGHTRTLWQLLRRYDVPVFVFVNKMDQPGSDAGAVYENMRRELCGEIIDFTKIVEDDKNVKSADSAGFIDTESRFVLEKDEALEEIALTDEGVMESLLETGDISDESIRKLIAERKVFPALFGSALKHEGVENLVNLLDRFMQPKEYGDEFSARVFKISRDSSGLRLTHLKVTGGVLKVRSIMPGTEEKVNQIRLYSGEKFETVDSVEAGGVCAIAGLTSTYPGMGIGENMNESVPVLEPVLTYKVNLPDKLSLLVAMEKFKELEEEMPELHIVWNDKTREIQAQIMGEVQIEILREEVRVRYGWEVDFSEGSIVYKETISDSVIGIGHFEPLRHYAEVHILLEPLERGSGMHFETDCSEDVLAKNWQRLILTHLKEREHKGVLTGSAITDMKITLIAGRAHIKHTEGGDFRQATYRAVRQGLMQATSVLLEPYYSFRIEVPEEYIGHAMTDIDRMSGKMNTPEIGVGHAVLTGRAPVSTMQGYPRELMAYTAGQGKMSLNLAGYDDCHNPDEVLSKTWYDPSMDIANPSASVFCAHGAGYLVDWDMVPMYAHVDNGMEYVDGEWDVTDNYGNDMESLTAPLAYPSRAKEEMSIGTDEIDAIINATSYANSKSKGNQWKRKHVASSSYSYGGSGNGATGAGTGGKTIASRIYDYRKEEYLLVDGYNIIFAWEELNDLSKTTIDGARGRLLDMLSNYQGIRKCHLIVVFDAYRLKAHPTEIFDYHNIHVVFTKEAETADQFIEKFAHENGRKYKVTVATSDGIEQIIIRSQGCLLMSARELEKEVALASKNIVEDFNNKKDVASEKSYLFDSLDENTRKQLFKEYREE